MRFKYRHHIVRDLAWAIASPPLIMQPGEDCLWYDDVWYQNLYKTSQAWFDEQDIAPDELQEKLDSQKDRRLGRYFETLWAFWLEKSPRYELLEQNLALRDEGKTLGELDFLVIDKKSGKCLHWEVAVKFYLGVGELRQHNCWHGPGKKDRLDLKVEHLRNHQSVIARRSQTKQLLKEKGYVVDDCGVILKGRLFYPLENLNGIASPEGANPNHLRSYWITMSDLIERCSEAEENKLRFSPLLGYGWMAHVEPNMIKCGHGAPWYNLDELKKLLNNGDYRLPLHLLQSDEKAYQIRFFLVSDDWMKEFRQLSG